MRAVVCVVGLAVLLCTPVAGAHPGLRPDQLGHRPPAVPGDIELPGGGVVRGAGLSGYFGPVFRRDGAADDVEVPDDGSLEPPSAVTVSVYVRGHGSPGAYRYLVAKGAAACAAASYGLYSGPAAGLMFYVSQNDGLSYARSPDAGRAVWDGRWHLAVGTYDGDAVRLYVDGRQIGDGTPLTGPIGYGLVGTGDLFFGRDGGCPDTSFPGTLAEPTVWSRALTPLELRAADDAAPRPAGGGGA